MAKMGIDFKKLIKASKSNIEKGFNFLNSYARWFSFIRRIEIRYRLIGSFLLISLVPFIIIGVLSFNKSKGAIEKKISDYSEIVIGDMGKIIGANREAVESFSYDLNSSDLMQKSLAKIDKMEDFDKLQVSKELKDRIGTEFTKRKEMFEVGVYLDNGWIDGDHSGSKLEEVEKYKDEAIKKGGAPVWNVGKCEGGNKTLVMSREIRNIMAGGTTMGYIAIGVTPEYFSSIFKEAAKNLGVGSELFIIDSDDKIIASNSDALKVGSVYTDKDLVKKLDDNIAQQKQVFSNGDNLVSFSHDKNSNWFIVCSVPYSYLNREANDLRNTTILIILVCFILAVLFALIISISISAPLKKLVKSMQEASGGNLNVELNDAGKDEIAIVATKFNEMMQNIRNLIAKVQMASKEVMDCAVEITSISDKNHRSSQQTAITIQEVATGASNQAEEIYDIVKNTNTLSNGINKVSTDMTKISDGINNTKKLSLETASVVRLLNEKAKETSSVSEQIVNDINNLNSDMREIKKIVKVIVGMAEQTNLLSLNAAIEAARAGEAGKGFSVVAGEVRKLADRSKESSININKIITEIQNKTQMTVNAANNSNVIISEQMDAVKKTDSAFGTIFSTLEGILGNIQNMSDSVKEMVVSKDQTLEKIENIAAVSEETAATSEEVSANTHEQTAYSQALTKLASDLNDMSKQLGTAISIFKID